MISLSVGAVKQVMCWASLSCMLRSATLLNTGYSTCASCVLKFSSARLVMMNKTTLISEMQKFHFGSKIFCSDGEDGILVYVIFDPTTRRMTHIGVKQGRLFGKTVHLPFDSVVDATGDGVTLNVKRADVTVASGVEVSGALLDSKSVVERERYDNRGILMLVAVHPQSAELAYIVAHHVRPGQDTMFLPSYVTALAIGWVTVTIPDAVL